MCFRILDLPRVELHCKLQEKLHRVTGPLVFVTNGNNMAISLCCGCDLIPTIINNITLLSYLVFSNEFHDSI